MKKYKNTAIYVVLTVIILYVLKDPLYEIFSAAERLSHIPIWAYILMFIFEILSFACVWALFKIVLPKASWKSIALSQLISNASSRAIPGGMVTGGAVQYKILIGEGISTSATAGALVTTSVLTILVLFAIPALSGLTAIFDASIINGNLLTTVIYGPMMLIIAVGLLYIFIKTDKPLLLIGRAIDFVASKLSSLFGKKWEPNEARLLIERDRLLETLQNHWMRALLASAGKWIFDALVLYTALASIGQLPDFSLFLIAYAGASVLNMVPITPGGIGFVEVGLNGLLMNAGVPSSDSELAVLVYRLLSFWFPLFIGLLALLFYKFSEPKKRKTVKN